MFGKRHFVLASVFFAMGSVFPGSGEESSDPRGVTKWERRTRIGTALLRHPWWIQTVAWSPDGKRLVSAGGHTVCVWDAETGRKLYSIRGHSSWVSGACVSPDGKMIVSYSGMNGQGVSLKCWDMAAGQLIRELAGHGDDIQHAAFSSDGRFIVSSGWRDHSMFIWDAKTGDKLQRIRDKASIGGHFQLLPDGKHALSWDYLHTARTTLWDIEAGGKPSDFGVNVAAWISALSPDGGILALPGKQNRDSGFSEIFLVDMGTQSVFARCKDLPQSPTALAFSRDNQSLITSFASGTLAVWNTKTGALIRKLPVPSSNIRGIAFSPDGTSVAVAGDSAIHIIDPVTGKETGPGAGNAGMITCMDVSHDGEMLAVGSQDNAIRLWGIGTGKEIGRLAGHTSIASVAISPDGTGLLSGGGYPDATLRHWDTANETLLHKYKAPGKAVLSVGFSPDGARAVSTHLDSDHPVIVWDLVERHPIFEVTLGDLGVRHRSRVEAAFGGLPSLVYAWDNHSRIVAWDFDAEERYAATLTDRSIRSNVVSRDMRFALVLNDADTERNEPNVRLLKLPRIDREPDRDKLTTVADKLGAEEFHTREEATKTLENAPGRAYAVVREAIGSSDPEVRMRAKRVVHACRDFRKPKEIGRLVVRRRLDAKGAAIDAESGLWAAIYKTGTSDGMAAGFVVGSFSPATGELKVIREFETDENTCRLRFIPGGRGVLVGNRDSTVTCYQPR